jgi:hypothetical protein
MAHPDRRHRSRTLRVAARTLDWRNGERFERDTAIETEAEQRRHPATGRWRWGWSAHEQGRLAVIVLRGTRPRAAD